MMEIREKGRSRASLPTLLRAFQKGFFLAALLGSFPFPSKTSDFPQTEILECSRRSYFLVTLRGTIFKTSSTDRSRLHFL